MPLVLAGYGAMPFSVPCDSAYLGMTISFQWAILRQVAVNQCPLEARLGVTQRLRATLGC